MLFFAPTATGQSINLSTSDPGSKHMAYLNFGYDYGLVTQFGYGYKIKTSVPLWAAIDFSRPMGGDVFDDLKTRVGVQYKITDFSNFALTARIHANYRAHQNEFVKMKSFGSEFSSLLGWYGSKWIAEAELGFDKAIITQLGHSDIFRENYSGVRDGWYIPAGGNWFYGFKCGRSIGNNALFSLELGATNAQGSDRNALIPRYLKFGFSKTF